MTVTTVATEVEERKKRRKNIIVFGIDEPKTTLKDQRIDSDKTYTVKLATETQGLDIKAVDLLSMAQLGQTENGNSKRPLLITFPTEEKKYSRISKS